MRPQELQTKITVNLETAIIKKRISLGKKKPLAVIQRFLGIKKKVSRELKTLLEY